MSDISTLTGTERAVCIDIAARQQIGIKKYGKTVAENPLTLREWMRHAYQSLGKAVKKIRSKILGKFHVN